MHHGSRKPGKGRMYRAADITLYPPEDNKSVKVFTKHFTKNRSVPDLFSGNML